jgi:23S rRNA (uracil1939-C5)-methyltransferase
MIKKNEKYIVDIIDNGIEGEGIAKIDNFAIFIYGAIKGEKVEVLIVKVLKNYAYGKILNIIEKSDKRVEVDCRSYKQCGGCNLRHVDYKYTLDIKKEIVQNLINKNLQNKIEIENIYGMDNPYNYRNKAIYPVGLSDDKAYFGVFKERTHEIIENDGCLIQSKISNEIAKDIVSFINENNIKVYDESNQIGTIRHIIIRTSKDDEEIMVTIVFNEEISKEQQSILVDTLTSKYPNIKSIIKNINDKNTNVILGEKEKVLFGDSYITDTIFDNKYKISSKSFYQVNRTQVERLYDEAIKSTELLKDDIVFDMYSGIGTIGLSLANKVKKVYGIEIVEDAVNNAKENAKLNNIDNIEFICGDTKVILDDLINKQGITPDVVFFDPPRKGLEEESINIIREIQPKKITYISCNPATLIRDISKLEDIYNIKSINLVDMFPFTKHIESIAVLELK